MFYNGMEGKEYKGHFSKVAGAASGAMFYLDVDGYYWGNLFYVKGHPGFNGPSCCKRRLAICI